MTDQLLTQIYVLLDRSGSMQSIKSDIEGGFAAFIEEQRAIEGDCRVTLARFDDHYEEVYADVAVAEVPPLSLEPRGSTALLDSMGRLITDAGQRLAALPEERRPGTVVVAIMTDGLENASREWTREAIKSLVEQQTNAYRWQFLYMGADQDAIEVGASIGVARDYAVTYGRGKSAEAMRANGAKISALRTARLADPAAAMPAFTAEERDELAD
ncbi:vWA domain-containing protein [Microlunatus speluncae]|uniref:vWA domain-containing protein n=1 Tax=Microlunatus speluncae TaxID=2594267 RepID=UPI0012664B0F|nr:vWA domain-containing protein [Microlunatus speluncae]